MAKSGKSINLRKEFTRIHPMGKIFFVVFLILLIFSNIFRIAMVVLLLVVVVVYVVVKIILGIKNYIPGLR